jgi:ATP-dependent RNA helicase DDX3X
MTGVSDALPAQEQPTTDPRPQAGNDTQKEVAPVEGWNERQAMDYSSMTKESAGPSEGAAQIYQWDDEFGDVGPKHPELELQLFGEPESRRDRAGLDFSK